MWYFKVEDDEIIWINKLNNKQTLQYPYLNDLRTYIDTVKSESAGPDAQAEKMKKIFQNNEGKSQGEIFKMVIDEKFNLLQHLMNRKARKLSANSQNLKQAAPAQIADISYDFKHIYELLGISENEVTKDHLINLLFYCPFDLTRDLPH